MAKYVFLLCAVLVISTHCHAAKEVLENAKAIAEWMQEENGRQLLQKNLSALFSPLSGPSNDTSSPQYGSGAGFDHVNAGRALQGQLQGKGDGVGGNSVFLPEKKPESSVSERSGMEQFSAAFPRLILQQIMEGKPVKVTLERESKLVFQRKYAAAPASGESVLSTKPPAEDKKIQLLPPRNNQTVFTVSK